MCREQNFGTGSRMNFGIGTAPADLSHQPRQSAALFAISSYMRTVVILSIATNIALPDSHSVEKCSTKSLAIRSRRLRAA
jgi:hypothetical protein